MQILAPHEETSVLTQLGNLPDDSQIEGAVGLSPFTLPHFFHAPAWRFEKSTKLHVWCFFVFMSSLVYPFVLLSTSIHSEPKHV